ncbi:hypothetical protein [Actinoplanes sp. GCM10030250]|uniref:hypothetical protein n=1 Tax=Actinoplanes sp. GCM10030250 TaxID=3273376 RepID=UPI003615FCD1
MKIKVRGVTVGALAAAAVVSTLAMGQPAMAADAYIYRGDLAPCPSGYTCLHDDSEQQFAGVGFYNDTWNFATIPSAYRFINNTATSGKNSTSGSNVTKLYDVAGGSGAARCMRAGAQYAQFNSAINNKASALVWASSCGSVTAM